MSLENSTRLSTSNVTTFLLKIVSMIIQKLDSFLDGKELCQTWQIHSMILKEHFGMDGFIGKCNGMFIFVNFWQCNEMFLSVNFGKCNGMFTFLNFGKCNGMSYLCKFFWKKHWNVYLCSIAHSRLFNGNLKMRVKYLVGQNQKASAFQMSTFV